MFLYLLIRLCHYHYCGVMFVLLLFLMSVVVVQVVIENQNNALEYDDIVVDQGSAVRQDMFFDKGGDHLYVMTSNKVSG